MRLKLVAGLVLFLFAQMLSAQVQLGIRTSNFGGINSTVLNPSAHLTTPYSFDINLVEVSQHFTNNYVYLENTTLFELLLQGTDRTLISRAQEENRRSPGPNEIAYNYYDDGRTRYGFEVTRLLGPSFYVALNQNHVVGLVTQFRALGSGTSIPDNLSFYKWRDRPLGEEFVADPFHSALLSAGEVGLNYMYRHKTSRGWLGLATTVKAIFGLESYYLDSPDIINLVKPSQEELTSEPFDMFWGFTTNALQESGYDPSINGSGMGFDFGATFTLDDKNSEGYIWKFGAAILDLGWVSFNQNAKVHELHTANVQTITSEVYANLDDPTDLEPAIQRLSTQLLGDPDATLVGDSYTMALPTALSLQADRYLGSNFFIAGTLVQSMPLSMTAPRRSSMLALTPRFENRWWGVAMPVVLQQWRDLHMGLSFRVGPLFIGTDDLGSFFPNEHFDSADVYLALKFNPFARDPNRERTRRKGQRLRCYDF